VSDNCVVWDKLKCSKHVLANDVFIYYSSSESSKSDDESTEDLPNMGFERFCGGAGGHMSFSKSRSGCECIDVFFEHGRIWFERCFHLLLPQIIQVEFSKPLLVHEVYGRT
jgi:hypothetical protein